MLSDEFFKKIGGKLDAEKKSAEQKEEIEKRNLEFTKGIVAKVLPTAKEYESKLAAMGLNVTVVSNDRHVEFKLRYADGGHRTLTVGPDIHTSRLVFKEYFTNDDGKNYSSESGSRFDESSWDDSMYASRLQKLIEDFMFYADRHGGTGAAKG